MYESNDERSKREFYYHESNNNNKTTLCHAICMQGMLFKNPHNKPLNINLDRLVITENIRPQSFMYGSHPTGSVRTVKGSVWYFPVMTTLSVNKKLIFRR